MNHGIYFGKRGPFLGPGDGRGISILRTVDGNTDNFTGFGVANAEIIAGISFVGIGAVDFSVSTGGLMTYLGPSGRRTNLRARAIMTPVDAVRDAEVGMALGVNGVVDPASAIYGRAQEAWVVPMCCELLIPSLQKNDTMRLYTFNQSQGGVQSPVLDVRTFNVQILIS